MCKNGESQLPPQRQILNRSPTALTYNWEASEMAGKEAKNVQKEMNMTNALNYA